MKKSFLSMFLALIMLAAMLPTTYATANKAYGYETDILYQLGIASDEILDKPDAEIKRMDFAVLVAGLRGYDGSETTESAFVDINSEHYAAGSIAYLKSLEIFNGYEDSTFRGENTITYAEAAKVLTSLLGYDKHAQIEGGWKKGYINIASSLKLNRGISVNADGVITQDQAMKMIYNALDTSICTVAFTDEGVKFASESDETPLNTWLHIDKTEGLVKTVGELSVTRDTASKNTLTVGTDKFYINDNDYTDYLGKYCEVYYYNYKSDNNKDVAAVAVKENQNSITTINSEDVISFEDGVLYYYEGKSTRRFNVTQNDEISLNGDPVAANDRENAILNSDGVITVNEISKGDITMVIMISAYDTYVVNQTDVEKLIIYGKYGKKLDMDDDDIITVFDEEGNPAEFEDIAVDDVLSIKKNTAETRIEIFISKDTLEGEFNGSYSEDGKTYNKIGTHEYELTADYERNSSVIEHGSKITAYIDMFGRIAYISSEKSAYTYGFLYNIKNDEDNPDEIVAHLYTLDGKFVKYNTDEKVKIDGDRPENMERLMTYLKRGTEGSTFYQLLRFAMNSKGKISKIDTAYQGTYESKDSLRTIHQGCDYQGNTLKTLVYKPRGSSFQNVVLYDTSVTKALTVPKTFTGDKEFFLIGKQMTEDDQVAFNAYVSTENQLTPDVLLFYVSSGAGAANELISQNYKGVVTEVKVALNSDDEKVYNVTVDTGAYGFKTYESAQEFDGNDVVKFNASVTAANAYKSYVEGNTDPADRGLKLCVGDYVEVAEDAVGKLRFVRKLVDGVTGMCYMDEADAGSIYSDRFVYGLLYQNDGKRIKVNAQKDFTKLLDSSARYFLFNNTKVYRVKTGRKAEVEEISTADLLDYKSAGERADKVMIYAQAASPKLVVAYE